VAVAAAALVYGVLHRTRFGLGVRTVIDHRRAAELVGVPVRRTMTLAFVLASAIGGLAGFLIAASEAQITPMFGMWATTKGLIAMMLGAWARCPARCWAGSSSHHRGAGAVAVRAAGARPPRLGAAVRGAGAVARRLLGGRHIGRSQAVERRV